MKIVEIAHGLTLNKPTDGYVRSEGVHMSTLYNSLYAELEPKRFAKTGEPDAAKMELGTAFEEVLEVALATRILGDRPGEFTTEGGIIYTPDHLIFNGYTKLGEFKATWMSIRKGITDPRFDKWFCQMKCYCHHLQTPYARLYVFFVNGDYTYKPPHGGASLRAWDIVFTSRELKDNWAMVERNARKKGLLPA